MPIRWNPRYSVAPSTEFNLGVTERAHQTYLSALLFPWIPLLLHHKTKNVISKTFVYNHTFLLLWLHVGGKRSVSHESCTSTQEVPRDLCLQSQGTLVIRLLGCSCSWNQDGWILAKFKKKRGQYPAILTKQAWSIKDLLYGIKHHNMINVPCGT